MSVGIVLLGWGGYVAERDVAGEEDVRDSVPRDRI